MVVLLKRERISKLSNGYLENLIKLTLALSIWDQRYQINYINTNRSTEKTTNVN